MGFMKERATADPGQGLALPTFRRILAVGAHPDDESFGLGAILSDLAGRGAEVWVLSFTHGEASTLGAGLALREVRARELAAAARALGVAGVRLLAYPDGGLAGIDGAELASHVASLVIDSGADALLVFDLDGVTGHPDHCCATEAALTTGRRLDLPVLAWAMPERVAGQLNSEFGTRFVGRTDGELDFAISVDRTRQLAAIARHTSQSTDNPVLWRRLELLGDREWLRYLRRRESGPMSRH